MPESNPPEIRRGGFAVRGSLAFIRMYQRWLSPVMGTHCRFEPTCSRFTYMAIERYGFLKGWALGLYRILRCNPFTTGGYDPVP